MNHKIVSLVDEKAATATIQYTCNNTQEKERGKANIFAPLVAIILTENEKKERVVKRMH
jgi:hypothetical protein